MAECCLHSYNQQDKEHNEESVPIKIKKGMKIALEVSSHEKSQASRRKMSRFQALLAIRKCCLILNERQPLVKYPLVEISSLPSTCL